MSHNADASMKAVKKSWLSWKIWLIEKWENLIIWLFAACVVGQTGWIQSSTACIRLLTSYCYNSAGNAWHTRGPSNRCINGAGFHNRNNKTNGMTCCCCCINQMQIKFHNFQLNFGLNISAPRIWSRAFDWFILSVTNEAWQTYTWLRWLLTITRTSVFY